MLLETERNELEILPREKHKFVHLEDFFNHLTYLPKYPISYVICGRSIGFILIVHNLWIKMN